MHMADPIWDRTLAVIERFVVLMYSRTSDLSRVNDNSNNKIQHLYSAIFTECSMALYIVSRIILKKNIYIHSFK